MGSARRWFAVALLVGGVSCTCWSIGRVYARIPNNANSPIYNLRIKTLRANVVIRDQLAVTSVDEEFANDNAIRLEGFYVFTLPPGAQVHELYLWINGVRTSFAVKKREDAVQRYNEIVTRMADPAILEQLGTNTFRLRIFPFDAHGTRRIEILYAQPLTYYKGNIQYVFPLDMRDYTSAPIETASLSIDLHSQLPITAVLTSADQSLTAVQVIRVDALHYTITYGLENIAFGRDFSVRAMIERAGSPIVALTYVPPESSQTSPYFLTWTALPDSVAGDSVRTRELTFVADVSSSMEGNRIIQTKDALLSFIDLLTDSDRFNIIAFSTAVAKFRANLVQATAGARDSARIFVSKLTALGLTNFEEALNQALSQSYADPAHAAILFVTDGQPSWGEISPDSLVQYTLRWNPGRIKLFPVGVGEEPDYALLEDLAKTGEGFFTQVRADDSIYVTVKELYRRVFLPRIRNVGMDFGAIMAYDVHPTPLPDLFPGDQLMTSGRFTQARRAQVRLTGMVNTVPLQVEQEVAFSDSSRSFVAVARYWGAQKIRSILDLIREVGEKPELVSQVISLSITYSVLTPYTAFLVVEPATGTGGGSRVDDTAFPPPAYALLQNSPNPFNPSTEIGFRIATFGLVRLVVYDLLGREVAVLVHGWKGPGEFVVRFDAAGLPSGMYLYRLTSGSFVQTRKMLLLQ
jgi:Ca-activated chloride channel family protein